MTTISSTPRLEDICHDQRLLVPVADEYASNVAAEVGDGQGTRGVVSGSADVFEKWEKSLRRDGRRGIGLIARKRAGGQVPSSLRQSATDSSAPLRMLLTQKQAEEEARKRFEAIRHTIDFPDLSEHLQSLDFTDDDNDEDDSDMVWFNPGSVETMLPDPVTKYRPPALLSVKNDYTIDNLGVSWNRGVNNRQTGVKVGTDQAWVGADVALQQRRASATVAWKDFHVNALTTLEQQEIGVGVKYGKYGVSTVRNNQEDATSVEVTTPYVAVGTLANFLDRNYGQKIRVKDFEIVARHDFNEHIYQDPGKLASEFMVSYKDYGVAVGTDVVDAQYGVSIGIKGYQFSVLRDFDERQTDFVGNFGDGWQLYISQDAPDPYSNTMFARVGFGNLKKAYVLAGAGVGDDGIPEFNARYHGKKAAIVMDLEGSGVGDRTLVTGFSFGKFTYVWNSKMALDNLRVPLMVGVEPLQVKNLLTPGSMANPQHF